VPKPSFSGVHTNNGLFNLKYIVFTNIFCGSHWHIAVRWHQVRTTRITALPSASLSSTTMSSSLSTLPPPRRIVTSHVSLPSSLAGDPNVEPAVSILFDGPLPQEPELNGLASKSDVWKTPRVPGSNNGSEDAALEESNAAFTGVKVGWNELAPGAEVPMHRTQTTDYMIFHQGVAHLITPSAPYVPTVSQPLPPSTQITVCNPGDVVIQRGTLHAWKNPSETDWARWIGVGVEAEKVVVEIEGADTKKVLESVWMGE